ncbi:DEAD/DEAH box helicase [Bradyrhizobium elkanii]|uniref:DEAD/DEAH box helicase n=1 Tax=Bradyrhizobium elkanii TaxID=29448 RepID=UPI0008412A6D|nr:DEAD/DEAH box helicase [Bradyrhizobium elkanii]ODM71378.1 hypothetical protein A6452_09400 [Bradyrhizobium elkanii]ODM76108.1 hypothetical protein A6X20_30300 [Bradyrhizobium elkanii]
MEPLLPIDGAWVCRLDRPTEIGVVVAAGSDGENARIEVDFGPLGRHFLARGEWGCGLQVGHCVQDVPFSGVRETLGSGTVLQVRELATRFQALVQFHSTGQSLWLPFERLRRIMAPALLFRRGGPVAERAAERLSLNLIGHALSKWNEATGALDRLDVDPLPHQISLVHRIISSGHCNWLIADDVGLGKTIEIGLLFAALERRQNIRRILLVVPSGLTRQWKEEMLYKFDRRFLIYGADFRVSDHKEWGIYEKVIVSLDLAKPRNADDDGSNDSTSFGMLLAAGNWDVVVFDEAHRLSRDDRGRSTLRFKLAQALRQKTDALLLLSGTPHQGDQAKFRNLLTLARPDLRRAIDLIEAEPDVVQEIVLRNRKIDVVDTEGKFLFKGVQVKRVEIEHDPQFASLERQLGEYLNRGYRAGDLLGGAEGRAIGFVMTIYRKMASSSVAALFIALKNRATRIDSALTASTIGAVPTPHDGDQDDDDDDHLESRPLETSRMPFFDNEAELLDRLTKQAAEVMRTDKKGDALVEMVRELVKAQNKKVLIFTEYRATQAYLLYRLERLLGKRPETINGSKNVDDKKAAIKAFESDNSVLISTEAGGEGLNLHRNCHVMINYDLPWNPSRISQRIGRLYRYGQKEQVIVFNFVARDTIDNEIMSILFGRLDIIVKDMASVGSEFNELYAAEVMGELLERIDISGLLEEARAGRVERTQERVDAALAQARRAKAMQDDVLSYAGGLDAGNWAALESYSTLDVATFVKRAAGFFGVSIEDGGADERFTMRLPSELKGHFPEFGGRTVIDATTNRAGWNADREVLIDFSTSFLKWLVTSVNAEDFGGGYAPIANGDGAYVDFFSAFLARFQNDQGQVQGERLLVIGRNKVGELNHDPHAVRRLLSRVGVDGRPGASSPEGRRRALDAARDRAELLMADELTRFKHPNDLVTLAVAEITPHSASSP